MLNLKKYYYSILKNSELSVRIGEDRILSAYPEKVLNFPCVIFEDVTQSDTEFSDNLPQATKARVRVHVYTKALDGYDTTTTLGKIIHDVFRNHWWACTSNGEASDPDTTVRHRIMEFSREFYGPLADE